MDDAEDRSELMARLVRIRRSEGITQQVIAEGMGVCQSTISGFENGRREPKLSTIQRYARVLGLSAHVVLVPVKEKK